MSALTANFDIDEKPGVEIRIQAAAVKNYRGGAAAVIRGVGFATPLVPATAGMQFIGVYEQDNDNSLGVAGTINNGAPNSGLSSWVVVKRAGAFCFNQSGFTQAAVGQRCFFSDDNTVTLTPGAIEAGIVITVDEANSKAYVDISNAVMDVRTNGPIPIAASGAVSPHNPGTYVVTKAGVAALTLAAPTATTDDGVILTITSDTANAHTITATGLLGTGTASVNVATFAAQLGAGLTLMAYQGKWLVLASVGITFS